jgi:hypothetical protein
MKFHHVLRRVAGLLVTVPLLVLTGCSDSNTGPVSSGVQPEVVNMPDDFQFQVTDMENYSDILQYNWNDTGTMANVDHSSVVTGGSAKLTLLDDSGVQVYSGDLGQDGSFASEAGASGLWKVQVTLTKCTGTLNFRVQKRTP